MHFLVEQFFKITAGLLQLLFREVYFIEYLHVIFCHLPHHVLKLGGRLPRGLLREAARRDSRGLLCLGLRALGVLLLQLLLVYVVLHQHLVHLLQAEGLNVLIPNLVKINILASPLSGVFKLLDLRRLELVLKY